MMPIKLCEGKSIASVKYALLLGLLVSQKGKVEQVYSIKIVFKSFYEYSTLKKGSMMVQGKKEILV